MIGLLSIAGFVCVFLIIFLIANNNLKSKSAENQAKIEELQESIEEQKKRSEDLDEQKEYTKTKEYIEKIAKEKLGLVYPNEIIFKTNE